MTTTIHINWGATADWCGTRARLRFLQQMTRTTMYGNFVDVVADRDRLKRRIKAHGFEVEEETDQHGRRIFRLRDGAQNET
jgi:hypothetical protein